MWIYWPLIGIVWYRYAFPRLWGVEKIKFYKWNIYVNVYPWRYPEFLFKWIFIIFNIMKKCVHVHLIFLDIDTINHTNFQLLLLIFWPFRDIFGMLIQVLSPVALEWLLQLCHLDIPKYSSRKWVLFGLLKFHWSSDYLWINHILTDIFPLWNWEILPSMLIFLSPSQDKT